MKLSNMNHSVWIVFFIFISQQVYSQGIKGKITNTSGTPVPYANIYIDSLKKGTTSNIEGEYELKLSAGTYKITYQYLGYKTQKLSITIGKSFTKQDITLEKQQYEIPEVIVYADSEDPAYHIMRKAISMAQYYKNQVESYDCRVYLKGTGILNDIPGLIKNQLEKGGIKEGETFITENISNIHFELPNEVEQEVISLRTNQYSQQINPMSYITLNFYQEMESPISPLDKRAFNVYKFELNKRYRDKGRLINKIKVIPKREGYDLFSGYIHIAEEFWNIHSVDLSLEQKMFKVNIRQMYSPVKDEIWMPVSHHFDVDFSALGFEGNFQYAGSVDYKTIKRNKALDHSFLKEIKEKLIRREKEKKEVYEKAAQKQKEANLSRREKKAKEAAQKEKLSNRDAKKINRAIKKKSKEKREKPPLKIKDKFTIADSAKKRSIAYWDSIRPIPLTEIEKKGYEEKDSMDLLMEDPEYRDSIKQAKKKFRFKHLLRGHDYIYEDKNAEFSFRGLIGLRSISFNTVDGFYYKKRFKFNKEYEDSRKWWLWNNTGYAFSRESIMSDLHLQYRYDPLKRAYINLSGGRKTADYNSEKGIQSGINMLTSLFLRENYIKFYQKDFIDINHQIDIANGLTLTTGAEFANRTQLSNNTDFNIWDPYNNNQYSSNNPENQHVNSSNTDSHKSFSLSGEISYTPRYYYKIEDNVKQMHHSNYPTFKLKYKGGIENIFGSETRYDYGAFSINDHRAFRGIGRIKSQIKAGKFFNNDNLFFADYKHFSSNTPFLAPSLSYNDFRLMDYYAYSTNKAFFEGHLKFRNDRILLKRLPVLNKTLMMENLYFHYLKIPGQKNYYEIGYGLDQVFIMFNLEVFAGFKGSHHTYTGFKLSLPILGGSQNIYFGG